LDKTIFYFFNDVGIYANRNDSDLKTFHDTLKAIDIASTELRMTRDDFESWIKLLSDCRQSNDVLEILGQT
jgi:hypothetical protein